MDRETPGCNCPPVPPGNGPADVDADRLPPLPDSTDAADAADVAWDRARVETASLFAWHRGRWGRPLAAVLCGVSESGATVVLGTDQPLPLDRAYALRLPRASRQPLWLICAVTSQEELGRGLLQVCFRFAAQILAAEAA